MTDDRFRQLTRRKMIGDVFGRPLLRSKFAPPFADLMTSDARLES
jgi:hypothetical protein